MNGPLVAREIAESPEKAIALTELARHLPRRNGKLINYNVIWRWTRQGIGHGLQRAFLETTFVGAFRYTSPQALQRFLRLADRIQRGEAIRLPQRRTGKDTQRFLRREGFTIGHAAKGETA